MKEVWMSLLSPILSGLMSSALGPLTRPQPHSCSRIIIKVSAFILLVSGYVLGCIALYHYLTPFLGEVFSLFSLCAVFLGTSLFLFILGWALRPKHNASSPFIEKTLKQVPHAKDVSKMLQDVPPALPIVALVIATGVAAYFLSKKREII